MDSPEDKKKMPLMYYFDDFVEKYLRVGRSKMTVRNCRDALTFLLNHSCISTIEDCNNAALLEDELHHLKEERQLSGVTINTYRKNINTYFIWLKRRGHIAENNVKTLQNYPRETKEQYILSAEQIRLIVGQIHTRRQTELQRCRNALFIDLLRFTGGRLCEILDIDCSDIVVVDETYVLRLRGKKQVRGVRPFRFPSWLKHSYERYIEVRNTTREDAEYLFVSTSKKVRWTEKGVRGLFRKLGEELGFRVTAYAFRRFVATHLNKKNVPLQDISRYLGHTRLSTTELYLERSTDLTDDAADIMGSA